MLAGTVGGGCELSVHDAELVSLGRPPNRSGGVLDPGIESLRVLIPTLGSFKSLRGTREGAVSEKKEKGGEATTRSHRRCHRARELAPLWEATYIAYTGL